MKTYRADDIARFFLARSEPDCGDTISNLKLQKLCYYACAVRGEPFFLERIEAWQHGPVVPELYRCYRRAGANAIPAPADFDLRLYEPKDVELLSDVYQFYGQFSAWCLREMTHEEDPWKDAYAEDDKEITTAALKKYFSKQVKRSYIKKYHGEKN